MKLSNSINIVSAFKEILSANELPGFCKFPISYAKRQLIHLTEGQILNQFFGYCMAQFNLFESSLNEPQEIDFSLDQPGIFLFMIIKGHAIFSDHQQRKNIESNCGRCYLSYIPSGNYHQTLAKGEHTTLVISLLPDWFIFVTKSLPEFQSLISRYLVGEAPLLNLPQCPLNQSIIRPFKRLQTQNDRSEKDMDILMNSFLHQLIIYYHTQLISKFFTASMVRKKKAEDLENFIKENFTNKIVDNVPKMADLFCISEKSLHRLAKAIFGIPLHEQIIRLRMMYSIKLILTTNKPIREVAQIIGYKDSFYFSKAFKKYHKISPSELR